MSVLHVIMPVKDSLDTTREAICHLYASQSKDWHFCLYNDFSSAENTALLKQWSEEFGFELHNWEEHTDHPSPNYRLTLIDAQKKALADNADLLIIESDVMLKTDTLDRLLQAKNDHSGMIAAVTHDNEGRVNFPYNYAQGWTGTVDTKKRFSFCCTLLTKELLKALPFESLNPEKDWFDVTISHRSTELGFVNRLLMDAPVLHLPHSSRPWKKLKYTNPLRYYFNKFFHGKDKI